MKITKKIHENDCTKNASQYNGDTVMLNELNDLNVVWKYFVGHIF